MPKIKYQSVPAISNRNINNYIQKASDQMRNMEISKEKMDALIDILKVLNELSPKPIQNYIELTMTAFQKADGTMNTCKKHSEEILEILNEIEKGWNNVFDDDNSWWNLQKKPSS